MGLRGKVKGDSFEMEYYRFGSGERTLVIIPGVSTKPVVDNGPALERVFGRFTSGFTVYLFDRKLNLTEGYSVRDMADDTADAMRRLGLKDAYIYAVSQGAMIAMTMAVEHSELVHVLYISSTRARQSAKSLEVFDKWMGIADSGDYKALYRSFFEYVYSPAFLEKFAPAFERLLNSACADDLPRFKILASAAAEFDIYSELDKIGCPVFVFGADGDRIMGAEGPREIAEKLGCPCFIYSGYGHAVYDEAPDFFERMYNTLISL